MATITITTDAELDKAIELQMKIDNGQAISQGLPEFTRETWMVLFLRQRLGGIIQRLKDEFDAKVLAAGRAEPTKTFAEVEASLKETTVTVK